MAPPWGDPVGILLRCLAAENHFPWTIVRRCLRDPTFIRCGTVPACDGQRDRQTDGRTDRHTTTAYTALA